MLTGKRHRDFLPFSSGSKTGSVRLYRFLPLSCIVLALAAAWFGHWQVPLAQGATKTKVTIKLISLVPSIVESGGSVDLSVGITGAGITHVTAYTLASKSVPATAPTELTSKDGGKTFSGSFKAPVNLEKKPVKIKVQVTVESSGSASVSKSVGSLSVNPAAIASSVLPLAYYHVTDSDGTIPGPDVIVALAFEPDGTADLYVATSGEVLAFTGTYAYEKGKLSLNFGYDDFHPHVTFSLDITQDTVKMPFKVFSTTKGTSTWARKKVPVEHNLSLIFNTATIENGQTFDEAMDRVMAYANAIIALDAPLVTLKLAPASLFGDPKLVGVMPLANGVRLQYDDGPPVDALLFTWTTGNGAALSLSPLAGDPRVHLDVTSPHNSSADPEEKTALFIGPFKTRKSFVWYDFYWVNKLTSIPSSEGYHLSGSEFFNFDDMQSQLEERGYTVQQLMDDQATVVDIIEALLPGKGGKLRPPGFIVINTHGTEGGKLATGVYLGTGNTRDLLTAELDRIQAAGYGDLFTYDGGSRDEPKTLDLMEIKRDMKPSSSSYFLAMTPKFWEWLKTRGANFGRSLVYIASCLTDKTPDLRNAIQSRGYFGFNQAAKPEMAGLIFQYFCKSLSRYSHSPEESYYNIIRVANTRQMIYVEDKLFDGFITEGTDAAHRITQQVFKGYGFDGTQLIPYQEAGWLHTPGTDPGAIWWLLFGGRWGQDAQGGADGMLHCWESYWSKGSTGGLADPECQNKAPGRVPAADEVGYASYLLTGEPVVPFSGTKVPRWTLNDGD